MKQLRGALVGFGNVAEHGHLPAWLARDDVQLVAVVEPDAARRARAQEQLPGVTVHDDLEPLLRTIGLDFVDVATPPALHVPIIMAAAEAGVHVLCEKPLAVSPIEYDRAYEAVTRAGVVLFTVDNWKHSEPFRRVRTLVDDGRIGPLRGVVFEVTRVGCARSAGEDWRTHRALAGGGILVDHGWHSFYLMLELAGEPVRAVGATFHRSRYLDADVEDTAHCTVQFPSCVGRLDLTWAGHERRTRWHLEGRDGEIEVLEDRIMVRSGGRSETFTCAASLSSSSHHPAWFNGVIDAFRREIDDPAVRGTNLAQAGQCVELLSRAYAVSGVTAPRPHAATGPGVPSSAAS
jgi:predicted dehydrogenase